MCTCRCDSSCVAGWHHPSWHHQPILNRCEPEPACASQCTAPPGLQHQQHSPDRRPIIRCQHLHPALAQRVSDHNIFWTLCHFPIVSTLRNSFDICQVSSALLSIVTWTNYISPLDVQLISSYERNTLVHTLLSIKKLPLHWTLLSQVKCKVFLVPLQATIWLKLYFLVYFLTFFLSISIKGIHFSTVNQGRK